MLKESLPLSTKKEERRRLTSGENSLRTPVTPILTVLMREILGPFNVYQLIACVIWIFRDYALYSYIILLFMVVAILVELYENRMSQKKLRQKSEVPGNLEFKKMGDNGEICFKEFHNKTAVPGDCIKISAGIIAPCDIIITSGECLVDESVLTGESVPIYKTEIPASDKPFKSSENEKHTIFCGSKILRSYTLDQMDLEADGLVSKTGFNTLKGQVTRNIMYPKNIIFKHEKESYKYLACLLLFSLVMMSIYYTFALLIATTPYTTAYVIFSGADIIFISFPPGLPLCLLIGISLASKRLRKMKVECLKPKLINAAGRVKTFCFDKTGTLTKTSMNFTGVSILNESKNL